MNTQSKVGSYLKAAICGITLVQTALCPTAVRAKTIAVWPMENGRMHNLVNYELPLKADDSAKFSADNALTWMTPPNPDKSKHLVEMSNRDALWTDGASMLALGRITHEDIGNVLCASGDFTLEGWIYIRNLPAANDWFVIGNVCGGAHSAGGWLWTVRQDSARQAGTDFELNVCGAKAGGTDLGDVCIGNRGFSKPDDVKGKWLHVAMTHCNDNGQGQSEWSMYLDGELWGVVTHDPFEHAAPADFQLELGGRFDGETKKLDGGIDYWRVSDRVLTPDELLCAGGEGVVRPPTAYYWKLGRTADGAIDGMPQVGRIPLFGGLIAKGNKASSDGISVGDDQAFVGNPPNTTVTLADGNAGSLYAPCAGYQWRVADLGKELEIDRNFTVEGWFKPERNESGALSSDEYLFNTRTSTGGWALNLHRQDTGEWNLAVFAQQTDNQTLVDNGPVSSDLSDWSDWKHVALVYDHAAEGGKGVWTCYLDGVKAGSATNAFVPTMTTGSSSYHIGGRSGTTSTFLGYIDCMRVSKVALSPNQLLCAATDCQAVENGNVLAFWPLNTKRSVYLCGDDLKNTYHLQQSSTWTDARMAGPSVEAPVIPNPDRSLAFAGSSTNLSGSVAFTTAENNNANNCQLSAFSSTLATFFRNRPGWTAEFYAKRSSDAPASTRWEVVFGVGTAMTTSTIDLLLNFSYRNSGFMIWDKGMNGYSGGGGTSADDKPFPKSTGSDLPKDKWTHVALTCQLTASNKIAYEVFVEGNSKGIVEESPSQSTSKPSFFVLGGRPHAANSFMGNISSLRLSSRVLDPSEFLCAAGSVPPPTAKETIAYWPLDFNGTVVDLTSRVPTAVVSNETVGVVGSTERAVADVPNPDKSEDFVGKRRANAGSISLSGADGHFSSGIGLLADVDASFTAEGWVKAALADNMNARSVICGTYDPAESRGWKLVLDTTGEKPCIRLTASTGVAYTRLVDDVMVDDVSGWDGAWKHLALTYDVHAGSRGVWTLFANGKVAKRVENRWSPQGVLCDAEFFSIGAGSPVDKSLSGSYDVWRLSRGVLTSSDFLRYFVPGFMVFLR